MKQQELLNNILERIRAVKEDQAALSRILVFLTNEVEYPIKDTLIIPEKYKKVVANIAELLQSNILPMFNPITLEVEEVVEEYMDDREQFEEATGEKWENVYAFHNWERCIEIKKMESHESFNIMESFTDQLENIRMKNKLNYALNNKKPFAHFNHLIHNSKYTDQWHEYKQAKYEEYIWLFIRDEFEDSKKALI
jgi:hypothetical protein